MCFSLWFVHLELNNRRFQSKEATIFEFFLFVWTVFVSPDCGFIIVRFEGRWAKVKNIIVHYQPSPMINTNSLRLFTCTVAKKITPQEVAWTVFCLLKERLSNKTVYAIWNVKYKNFPRFTLTDDNVQRDRSLNCGLDNKNFQKFPLVFSFLFPTGIAIQFFLRTHYYVWNDHYYMVALYNTHAGMVVHPVRAVRDWSCVLLIDVFVHNNKRGDVSFSQSVWIIKWILKMSRERNDNMNWDSLSLHQMLVLGNSCRGN